MKRTKKFILAIYIAIASLFSATIIAPAPVFAEDAYICSNDDGSPVEILGIRMWCSNVLAHPNFKNDSNGQQMTAYIGGIIINVTEMLLGISSYVAIAFVFAGGFIYMTAMDNAGKTAKGIKFITNSMIGLVIMRSAALVIDIVADIADVVNEQSDNGGGISGIAQFIANEAFFWGGVIVVLMILWGAVQYVTSAGNPAKMSKGKKIILTSTTGLIILMFSAVITNVVMNQFKYENNAYQSVPNVTIPTSIPDPNASGASSNYEDYNLPEPSQDAKDYAEGFLSINNQAQESFDEFLETQNLDKCPIEYVTKCRLYWYDEWLKQPSSASFKSLFEGHVQYEKTGGSNGGNYHNDQYPDNIEIDFNSYTPQQRNNYKSWLSSQSKEVNDSYDKFKDMIKKSDSNYNTFKERVETVANALVLTQDEAYDLVLFEEWINYPPTSNDWTGSYQDFIKKQ